MELYAKLHVIDGDRVILDLDELIQVAGIASRNARDSIHRYQGDIDQLLESNNPGSAAFYANSLAEAAQEYAQAMETYYALVSAQYRDKVEVRQIEEFQ